MASPFHETPGPHKYGDYEFKWFSLLNTPCYGFSGPNACYSTTCTHNAPLTSELEKQLTKSKLPNSSKISYKFYMNAKKFAVNCERAAEHATYETSLTTQITVQMEAHGYSSSTSSSNSTMSTYDEYETNFNGDVNYHGGTTEIQPMCDDSSMLMSRDMSQLFESSGYYCHSETNNLPYTQHIQAAADSDGEHTLANTSTEIVLSAKKYTFNPLSEPFHPLRNIYNTTSSSSASVTTNSSECESIASTTPTTKCSSQIEPDQSDGKFVCILCPDQFDTLAELKEHLKNKVQQPHDCVICGISFGHNYLLDRHMKQHRSLKVFRCRGCNKKFRSLNQLVKHFEFCRYKLYMFI